MLRPGLAEESVAAGGPLKPPRQWSDDLIVTLVTNSSSLWSRARRGHGPGCGHRAPSIETNGCGFRVAASALV
jgi:hypothetical protein